MYQVIAATLFAQKKCNLPGLGYLSLSTTTAQLDFANTQLLSPQYQVQFVPVSNGEQKFNEFSAISQLIKSQLDTRGEVHLDGLGKLYKTSSGDIEFAAIPFEAAFLQPVPALRVLRADAAHQVQVGDKQIVTGVVPAVLPADLDLPQANSSATTWVRWWYWAIVFALIAISGFAIYFSKYKQGILGNMQP
jgi:hypothetical protein